MSDQNPEANKLLCRRMIQRVLTQGELGMLEMFFTPDAVHHDLDVLADSLGNGNSALREALQLHRRGFPDLRFQVVDQICEGDRVVTRWQAEGTQTGPFLSIQPSGRPVRLDGVRVDRMARGRIVESWTHFDLMDLLGQIGAMPAIEREPRQLPEMARAAA